MGLRDKLPFLKRSRGRRLRGIHIPDRERLGELVKVRRGRDLRSLFAAGAAGAVLAYFLDPDRGNRRRKMGLDRVAAAFRRAFGRAGRAARRVSSDTYGATQRVAHWKSEPEPADDETLAQRVQSEIFRGPDVPKGRVNVNVERGIVFLRGELDDREQIRELEEGARRVPGVRGVESLLSLTDPASEE